MADAALRAAAEVGPFFAVDLVADGPQWIDLSALVDDPAVMKERVSVVRSALAHRSRVRVDELPGRVVASVHSLGLFARLVAPPLGAAVTAGTVPGLTVDRVRWQRRESGPVPVAFVGAVGIAAAGPGELASALDEAVIGTVVEPLVEAFAVTFRLSRTVLWGNVASAVGGAVTMLTRGRPDRAQLALAVADRLLHNGRLAGHGRYVQPGRLFRRNSCCLYYRLPDAATCGDCVLNRPDRAQ